MERLEGISNSVKNRVSIIAVLIGLGTASYAVLEYHRGGELSLFNPVFVTGLVIGLIFDRREIASRTLGYQTGLVASVAVFVPVLDVLVFVFGLPQPTWATVAQICFLLAFTGLMIAVSGLLGMVGAIVGEWFAGKTERYRPRAAG